MKNVELGHNVIADDDIWEDINSNQAFNDFIGKCVTHFAHFVVPRRDQEKEIVQLYDIPDRIDDTPSNAVRLTRKVEDNTFLIEYENWM